MMEASLASLLLRQFISGVIVGEKLTKVEILEINPCQATYGIFQRTRKIISQFVWKYKNPQIAKAILRKKNGTG